MPLLSPYTPVQSDACDAAVLLGQAGLAYSAQRPPVKSDSNEGMNERGTVSSARRSLRASKLTSRTRVPACAGAGAPAGRGAQASAVSAIETKVNRSRPARGGDDRATRPGFNSVSAHADGGPTSANGCYGRDTILILHHTIENVGFDEKRAEA